MLKWIIFDLDDTLYPREKGLLQEVGRRIQLWLMDNMSLSPDDALKVRRDYFQRYGTTLGGLVAEHQVDTHSYLVFVHDIPIEQYIQPLPALDAMLAGIPLRKAIYTNATTEYSQRVTQTLGIAGHFEQTIGIEEVGLRNKPYPDALERTLELLGAQGPECIMVEDSARNLQPARALGLTTILVNGETDDQVDYVLGNVLEVGSVVAELLAAGPDSQQV
jgi:putative hydrolase of the HAD superfamily